MKTPFSCRASRSIAAFGSALAASFISMAACAADQNEHHHPAAKEVAAFHSTLAPLWHAPAGQARIDNACAQAATLVTLAKDIKSRSADALKLAVDLFKEQCQTKPAEAEAAFGKVHDAFHKVSEH